ncbi:adenosylcobinamide-GDP ribazoletransferase [Pseudorhodobacter sp.]|uniref:adenosylcobinamide-GDP ribazoletransferase n=1 Tax=Pseudorhodobacter sp. TaxID=1934400 RepID=UPI002B0035C4|nr:adenosylcobinamide-GDP ribazoletransferase [Pseudorhodobacter sp.]
MKYAAQFQLAVMMMTRLPAGRLGGAPSLGASVWAFPLVGGIVGGLAAMVMLVVLWFGVAPALAAGLGVLAMVVCTGGLHEDGLADVADGFGGGRDRAHKLEIMRDSQIGSYGALALILSMGLRWQGLAGVLTLAGPWTAAAALVALAMASRAGLAAALWLMPAARSDGLGRSAAGTSADLALISAVSGAVALVVFFGWPGAAIAAAMAAVQVGFAALAKRQIGGQTGDVLGAMQQLAEISGWVMISAIVYRGL